MYSVCNTFKISRPLIVSHNMNHQYDLTQCTPSLCSYHLLN